VKIDKHNQTGGYPTLFASRREHPKRVGDAAGKSSRPAEKNVAAGTQPMTPILCVSLKTQRV
jgi:hypothetical protein